VSLELWALGRELRAFSFELRVLELRAFSFEPGQDARGSWLMAQSWLSRGLGRAKPGPGPGEAEQVQRSCSQVERSRDLPLPLLEARVLFVDHIQLAFPAHDLAINATLFNGCSDSHLFNYLLLVVCQLFITENDPSPAKVVWTHLYSYLISGQDPDVVHPHLTGNGRQYFVAVFELHFEHSIRKCFYDRSVLFNECLFRHTFWVRKDMGITRKYENQSLFFHRGAKKRPN
jgi:hypothetical protein